MRARALPMVAEHREDYPSVTAVSKAVADRLGVGKETVRRWVVQAEIDTGAREGLTSEEHAEIKRLKAENRRLREDNEALKAASISSRGNSTPAVADHVVSSTACVCMITRSSRPAGDLLEMRADSARMATIATLEP